MSRMGAGGAGASSVASRLGIRVAILGVVAGLALGVDAVADRSGNSEDGQAASPVTPTSRTSNTPGPTPASPPSGSDEPTVAPTSEPTQGSTSGPTPAPTRTTPPSRGPDTLPGVVPAGAHDGVRVNQVWVTGFDPGDGGAGVILWRARDFIETASGGSAGTAWVSLRQLDTGGRVRITFGPSGEVRVKPLNDVLGRVLESRSMPGGARALLSIQSGR